MTTSVIFLKVLDNTSKAKRICQTIQTHFDEKQSVMVLMPNQEAVQYLDQLLWRSPEDSFLPHVAADQPTDEAVVITTLNKNLNNAAILFNLCSKIAPMSAEFATIYDLYDETNQDKLVLSRNRHREYQAAGFTLKGDLPQ